MLGWLRPASHPTKKMADIVTPAELVRIVERTLQDIDPTEGDLLFAAERQRTRILERTARGVDFEGRPFAPYSERGPYYRRGVKYASYADYKRQLGRNTVDLTGDRAPHMLQATVSKARGAVEAIVGIYGAEADRASGHNEGNPGKGLPQRRFLDASDADVDAMLDDIRERVLARTT